MVIFVILLQFKRVFSLTYFHCDNKTLAPLTHGENIEEKRKAGYG